MTQRRALNMVAMSKLQPVAAPVCASAHDTFDTKATLSKSSISGIFILDGHKGRQPVYL